MNAKACDAGRAAKRIARVFLVVACATGLAACESFNLFGGGGDSDERVQVRGVVAEATPFYESHPDEDTIPFVYLTRGTSLEWEKKKGPFSKVRLANGTSGWVSTANLGPPSVAARDTLAPPESQPTEDGVDDGYARGSAAMRTDSGDEMLNHFNRP